MTLPLDNKYSPFNKFGFWFVLLWLVVLLATTLQREVLSLYSGNVWVNTARIGLYGFLCLVAIWNLWRKQFNFSLFYSLIVVFIASGIVNYFGAKFYMEVGLDNSAITARMLRTVWYFLVPIWLFFNRDEFNFSQKNWLVNLAIVGFVLIFGYSVYLSVF